MNEGRVVVALMVLQFAREHLLGDLQDFRAGVVERHPALWHAIAGDEIELPLGFRPGDVAGVGERYRAGAGP
jgi:hypothetical protein